MMRAIQIVYRKLDRLRNFHSQDVLDSHTGIYFINTKKLMIFTTFAIGLRVYLLIFNNFLMKLYFDIFDNSVKN